MNAKTIKVVEEDTPALLKQIDEDQRKELINKHVALALLAAEIGYKHCERGANLQEALIFVEQQIRGGK